MSWVCANRPQVRRCGSRTKMGDRFPAGRRLPLEYLLTLGFTSRYGFWFCWPVEFSLAQWLGAHWTSAAHLQVWVSAPDAPLGTTNWKLSRNAIFVQVSALPVARGQSVRVVNRVTTWTWPTAFVLHAQLTVTFAPAGQHALDVLQASCFLRKTSLVYRQILMKIPIRRKNLTAHLWVL